MSQQINLFNPAYRKRRIVLTALRVIIFCGLAVVAMSGFWFYEYQVVNGLKEELRSAQNLLKAQRTRVDQVVTARTARQKDQTLENEIQRLEAELKGAREQFDTLTGGAAGDTRGFAEYLRAFSRQSIDGLWLTSLEIRVGGEITIRGRAVNPGLVPAYIQRLDREEVLRGRSFAAFNIARPESDAGLAATQKKTPATPRFLEFSLATAEPSGGAARTDRAP
jgi:hypothetical protein